MRLLPSFAPFASGSSASSGRARPAPAPAELIPEVPPQSVRQPYLSLSRSYLRWCVGMMAWAALCVGYFVLTWQPLEMTIAVCLGLLLLANVLFPAAFFGGATWYKRLGWATVLTTLFAAMFAYPLVAVAIGVYNRFREGRYHGVPYFSDVWHALLSVMTIVLASWTVRLAFRGGRIVRQLRKGQYTP